MKKNLKTFILYITSWKISLRKLIFTIHVQKLIIWSHIYLFELLNLYFRNLDPYAELSHLTKYPSIFVTLFSSIKILFYCMFVYMSFHSFPFWNWSPYSLAGKAWKRIQHRSDSSTCLDNYLIGAMSTKV